MGKTKPVIEFGGFLEILIIGVAALILLGPKELPVVLQAMGRLVFKCRQLTAGVRHYIDHHLHQGELDAFEESAHNEAQGSDKFP